MKTDALGEEAHREEAFQFLIGKMKTLFDKVMSKDVE